MTPSSRRVTGLAEVKQIALAQVATGGVQSLSLNAIARTLGLTGPALYRYVSGRDELVTLLLVDAYEEFADVLTAAAGAEGTALDHLRSVGRAYRGWARDHRGRYELLYGTPLADYRAPVEATRPPAQRALAVLAGIFADNLDLPTDDPEVRRRAVAAWTRAHGLVHLELHGHLGAVGVDLDALFEEEVASLLDAP